jgi:hypothetical protein
MCGGCSRRRPVSRLRPLISAQMQVPFRGNSAGLHPLTWGQKDLYQALARYSRTFNMKATVPVPANVDLPQVGDALRWALERYEGLRTVFPASREWTAQQCVLQEGRLSVPVLPTGREGEPGTEQHGFGRPFDLAAELPIRCALIADGGVPRRLVLELSRLTADLWARRILERTLAARLAGAAHWQAGPAHQPADQATAESQPASTAASAASAAYIARLLDTYPVTAFPAPGRADESTRAHAVPSRPRAKMTSPALGWAVGVLSRRYRVSVPSVYLAYVALLISALSGTQRFIANMVSSNRWIPGGRDYLGTLNQYVPVAIHLGEADFPAVLRRVQSASLLGFSHGLYDIADLKALAGHDALGQVDCTINVSQPRGRSRLNESRPSAAVMAATSVTELPQVDDFPGEIRRSLHLLAGGTSDEPQLTLTVNRSVVPVRPDALLRDLESRAVRDAEAAGRH